MWKKIGSNSTNFFLFWSNLCKWKGVCEKHGFILVFLELSHSPLVLGQGTRECALSFNYSSTIQAPRISMTTFWQAHRNVKTWQSKFDRFKKKNFDCMNPWLPNPYYLLGLQIDQVVRLLWFHSNYCGHQITLHALCHNLCGWILAQSLNLRIMHVCSKQNSLH
jgi:hypothetical protein